MSSAARRQEQTHHNAIPVWGSSGRFVQYIHKEYRVEGNATLWVGQSQTTAQNHRDGVDWGYASKASKYGNVNTTAITTVGQSCGGLEAMLTAYHDERAKRIVMLNIAIFRDERRYLLQEIKVHVA